MKGAVVPVGHYLGGIYDERSLFHRVRVGLASEPLQTADEAAVWLTAHSITNLPPGTVWTRQRILDMLPDPAGGAAAFPALFANGLMAEVDDTFADRFRVVPLTYGIGWRHGEDGLALGAGDRAVYVDETVLSVWERGADFPTLRAACADAAPHAPGAALDATIAALHPMLAVSAVYIVVPATSR
jgi:hypothetical protein